MRNAHIHKKFWDKRIPTIPALLLLMVSIFVTSYLIQTGVFFVGKASPDTTPQSIKVTNITDTSFTVTFLTNEKSLGAVTLSGKDELTSLIYDDRDKPTGKQNSYYSHTITVPNLKPSTVYYFTILSNSTKYLNNGNPFLIKTGPTISTSPPQQKPLFGKILLPDGEIGSDVLLLVSVPDGQPISAVTKNDGTYIIPTNSIRNDQLNAYLPLKDGTPITITAKRQEFSTVINVIYKDGSAIPPVSLNQNYNFTSQEQASIATTTASLVVPEIDTRTTGSIRIIVPQSNQSFVDKRPQFQGTALPNRAVKITISEAKIQTSVQSDRNGYWSYRPDLPLESGKYTFQIETQDSVGITTKLQQPFSIFASGSQLSNQEVPSQPPLSPTKSPTPTPSPSPVPSKSPTPTLSPTRIPSLSPTSSLTPALSLTPTSSATVSATPTSTPTFTPTATPSPTKVVIMNTPTKIPPVTIAKPGSTSSIILSALSVLFIVSGTFLLFML